MFLNSIDIQNDSFVTDIVIQDYRTSSIFRKYGIDYCCGGKVPLQMACELRGLDIETIKSELRDALRTIQVSSSINFNNWNIDFLVDYIVNVHHAYLANNFPDIIDAVTRFVQGHKSKYPHLVELPDNLLALRDGLLPQLEQEERIIFPYIKQVGHAYMNHEPYAALLVRTLRKPVENMMEQGHAQISKYLHRLRELTNNYTPAPNACITHKVSLHRLKELDNDLVQHVHLEANILFPKAIAMEKEMLALK
jgi:Regulator of cell morphogenesis and NO signaling